MRVVIVDDEPAIRVNSETMIKEWGYETATAANGEEAWRELRDDARPLIVLLEAGKRGLDLCARIRREKAASPLYVILVTGKSGKEDVTKVLDAGADDYIAKPLRPFELRGRLAVGRRVLEYQYTMENLSHELRAKTRELSRMSTVDGLTGIASRGYFSERLNEEWRRALRENTPLSLIMLDLDFFKAYNDVYGHMAGDECLKKVAKTVAATIARASDLAARYGGEEFAVVLPNTDSLGTLVVAEAARVAVATLGIEHKQSTIHRFLTLSAGTATLVPSEEMTPAVLIAKADQALYQAKQAGRNNVKQAI